MGSLPIELTSTALYRYIIMFVFIESDKNGFTTYINPPLTNITHVRLVSCSLYNSWNNLTGGVLKVYAKDGSGYSEYNIPDAHYTPATLSKEFAKHGSTLTIGLPYEWELSASTVNKPIQDLLGFENNKFKWNYPSNYEVHCNLVQSYDNGYLSHVIAKFPPKGNPYGLVEYQPYQLLFPVTNIIYQIHILVKVDGKEVNFNNKISLTLEFLQTSHLPLH